MTPGLEALRPVSAPVLVQYLWLPGRHPSTNQLLSMQRADGYYAAKREGLKRDFGRGSGRRPKVSYADTVRALRDAANMHARAARLKPVRLVDLFFHLIAHDRFDPSAWYLSAKAFEDGLADAGVFDSDRFDVRGTAGRCSRDCDEDEAALTAAAVPGSRWGGGMLVTLTEVGGADR